MRKLFQFRILDEKDKLARLCAQIASFNEEDGAGYGGSDGDVEDRRSHFDEMLKLSGELGECGVAWTFSPNIECITFSYILTLKLQLGDAWLDFGIISRE